MSAIVCGKRLYVDDQSPISASSPAAKRFRRLSSPIRSPSPPQSEFLVDQLRQRFPRMASEVLENVAAQCGNDLEAAIAMMYKLALEHKEVDSAVEVEPNSGIENGPSVVDGAIPSEDSTIHENTPANGEEWVELVLTEMNNATSIDDAKARAARVLQKFEKAIQSHTMSGTAPNLQKDNLMLKEQLGVVLRENTILKRAVSIQHERQKEFDDRVREVQHLKQMVTQYQEQVRTLEVRNYALSMYLQQAQQSNFTQGRFPPDIC
ncbi:hypothetical protein LIER_40846 [Lithospermum erythrorhizon]|uniref:CUE domain-containing protein n=1 Tax=Lithospermum erythrorhizon TaxID=34254 RepID=A0AAV3R474_LITER